MLGGAEALWQRQTSLKFLPSKRKGAGDERQEEGDGKHSSHQALEQGGEAPGHGAAVMGTERWQQLSLPGGDGLVPL